MIRAPIFVLPPPALITTVCGVTPTRDALLRLAAAAATFTPEWDDPEPLDYVDVWDLVSHLQSQLAEGEADEVAAVLQLAEELLAEGDPGVDNFLQVGFFESIQNTSESHGLVQEAFEPYLGPRSKALWLELNNLWGGSTTPD